MIGDYRNEIQNRDGAAIYEAFEKAGEYRNSLPAKASTLVGKLHELFVNVDDKPGVIARVSAILAEDNMNIKNIGIINKKHKINVEATNV